MGGTGERYSGMARDVTLAPAMLVNTDPACPALTDAATGGGASGLREVRLHSQPTPDPAVVAREGGALGVQGVGTGSQDKLCPRPLQKRGPGRPLPTVPLGREPHPGRAACRRPLLLGSPNPLSLSPPDPVPLLSPATHPPTQLPGQDPALYFLCRRPRDWPAGSGSLSAPSSAGRSGNFLRLRRT